MDTLPVANLCIMLHDSYISLARSGSPQIKSTLATLAQIDALLVLVINICVPEVDTTLWSRTVTATPTCMVLFA